MKNQNTKHKIPNTKNSKGITLIALILTILVLLILAVVAINSVQDRGIIAHAKNATSEYQKRADEENSLLEGYLAMLEENLPREAISKTESYVGYYADVDGNGSVDGIIYADLAQDGSGQWTNGNGAYEYSKKENLNNYYISQESYQYKNFEEKPVIAPIDRVEENDRFYVMALEDFTTPAYTDEQDSSKSYPAYTTYYWYRNALTKMDASDTKLEFGEGRENTKAIIEIWNKNGGTGGYEGATQDNNDLWKHIQTKVSEGWFIPSRGEWGAFGAFATENGLTNSNNAEYGLSNEYWSSSQYDTSHAWNARFNYGYMYANQVHNSIRFVRLSTTF